MSDAIGKLAVRMLLGMLAMAGLLALAACCRGDEPPAEKLVRAFEVCYGTSCARHEWRELGNDPQRHHLFRFEHGSAGPPTRRQVGAWCYVRCHWRSIDARGHWSEPTETPPFPVPGIPVSPAPPAKETEEPRLFGDEFVNHGIDLEKLRGYGRTYTRNGLPCDRRTSFEALGHFAAAAPPDDADAMRLTFVGPADQAERIRRDLEAAAELAEWRGKVAVQCFESPDEPLLRGQGFTAGLQLQDADGRRLGAEATYAGPEALAEGLRNADRRRRDPDWKPTAWPRFRDPETPRPLDGLRDLSSATAWIKRNGVLLLLGGGLLALLLWRRKAE